MNSCMLPTLPAAVPPVRSVMPPVLPADELAPVVMDTEPLVTTAFPEPSVKNPVRPVVPEPRANPVPIHTLPLFPDAAFPVLINIPPELPAVVSTDRTLICPDDPVPLDDVMLMEPPDVVPTPDAITRLPPACDAADARPVVTDTAPPPPVFVVPTARRMEPAAPPVAAPVTTLTAPGVPNVAAPLRNVTKPVLPDVNEFVNTEVSVLDVSVAAPAREAKYTLPPVDPNVALSPLSTRNGAAVVSVVEKPTYDVTDVMLIPAALL